MTSTVARQLWRIPRFWSLVSSKPRVLSRGEFDAFPSQQSTRLSFFQHRSFLQLTLHTTTPSFHSSNQPPVSYLQHPTNINVINLPSQRLCVGRRSRNSFARWLHHRLCLFFTMCGRSDLPFTNPTAATSQRTQAPPQAQPRGRKLTL
jgi:hypothetical protein